jgi:hypothetical protein
MLRISKILYNIGHSFAALTPLTRFARDIISSKNFIAQVLTADRRPPTANCQLPTFFPSCFTGKLSLSLFLPSKRKMINVYTIDYEYFRLPPVGF